jgi:hypothetical protein
VLLVGEDLSGERQTGIKPQMGDGDKCGILGPISEIEATYDASLVTSVTDPGDGASSGGSIRDVFRNEGSE